MKTVFNRLPAWSAILPILVATSFTEATAQDVATKMEDLVGTWRVVSYTIQTGETTVTPLGERPQGYFSLNSQGRAYVFLFQDGRQPPAKGPANDEEALKLYRSMVAWTGMCTMDETPTPDGSKITCKVDQSWNQALTGQERSYFMLLDGSRLVIKSITQPSVQNAQPSISFNIYERAI